MKGHGFAVAVGLVAAAHVAGGCGGGAATVETAGTAIGAEMSSSARPKLVGRVGSADDPDAYEITLTTEDGEKVTSTLLPGRYVLEIDDRSTIHNFHLSRRYGGLDVATEVASSGEKTAVVLLNEPQSYVYVCDAHPARMGVTFSIHDRIRTQN